MAEKADEPMPESGEAPEPKEKAEDSSADQDPEKNEPPANPAALRKGDVVEDVDQQDFDAKANIAMAAHQQNIYLDGGGARREAWSTGTIDDETMRRELRYFVDPPGMTAAEQAMVKHGLVVLVGPEGSGRRAAAHVLLHRAPASGHERSAPIVLSPSMSAKALSIRPFGKGARGLLADHLPDGLAAAERRFAFTTLSEALRSVGAALVVTTLASPSDVELGDMIVVWESVPAEEVLDRYIDSSGVGLTEDDHAQARAAIAGMSAKQVRDFIEEMESKGIEAALGTVPTVVRQPVRNWFAATRKSGPDLVELLPVVTAAFLPGAQLRAHEHASELLRRAINRDRERDDPMVPLAARERLVPSRSLWPDFVRPGARAVPGGEPPVQLQSAAHHEAIFDELVLRYGPELWAPLRAWQLDLPLDVDLKTALALAQGMAVFATIDTAEVRRVLREWAGGLLNERWTAAYTLHWMAPDSRTATVALDIAVGWCRDDGQRRAVTAAWAFALHLGTRFPKEALSWVWHLAMRGSPVREWARSGLIAFVRNASVDTPTLARTLRELILQNDNVARTRRLDHGAREHALAAVAAVLMDGSGEHERSLTSRVLREHPSLVGELGQLWAAVTGGSFALRARALDHLRTVFEALEADPRPGDRDAVAGLGAAMRDHLDDEHWTWLQQDLPEVQW